MPEDFVPQVRVDVDGREIDDDVYDACVEVRAESSLQLPDRIQLRFNDPDFELYDRATFSVGRKITIALSLEGAPRKIAECEITSIGMQPGSDGRMALEVTALGRDHRLHRGVALATYADQTDSEIVGKIAEKVGLTADVDSTSTRHPHVTQATTDHRFLCERADLVGYRWWVDGSTLKFKKSVPDELVHTVRWGQDLLDFRVVASSASANGEANVRSWDPDTQQAITGSARSDPDLDALGTDASGPTADAKESRRLARKPRFLANVVTDDATSANNLARGLCRRAADDEIHMRGEVRGDPGLKAGDALDITEIGTRLSGTYRLASVEHVYRPASGYVTRFASGGQNASHLIDLFRSPAAPTAPWDPHALVIGVVSNIEDPDRPSRVKVRFPTFSDEYESAWARLALPGAGPDRGLHVLPEIGDEVLVGFEHGNAQRPIVLGGLWSAKSAPPVANDAAVRSGRVAVRTWKSRAGHSITINDAEAEGEDAIVVQLAEDQGVFRLGKDKVVLETPVDIEVTTKKSLSLTAKADVTIKGANVKITADSDMTLEAAQFSATGNATASLEGGTVDVKGNAKASIDGGGLTEVKGGMVKLN